VHCCSAVFPLTSPLPAPSLTTVLVFFFSSLLDFVVIGFVVIVLSEYGLGMFTAMKHRREKLITIVQNYVHQMDLKKDEDKSDSEKVLVSLLQDWLDVRDEKSDKCTLLFDRMKPLFQLLLPKDEDPAEPSMLSQIWSERDMFPKISQWIVGGDGWAYDIGFGGLDHVEAFEANDLSVLVVDTGKYTILEREFETN